MENLVVKKPIAQVLHGMEVGDRKKWPIEQYDSVRVTVGRQNKINRRQGIRYGIKSMGMTVEVVRIA